MDLHIIRIGLAVALIYHILQGPDFVKIVQDAAS